MAVLPIRCRAASESGETQRLASLPGVSDRAVLGHTPHSQEWLCYGNGCAAEWLCDCGCLARGGKASSARARYRNSSGSPTRNVLPDSVEATRVFVAIR